MLVVFYHVLWMYNDQGVLGGLGPIGPERMQWYDIFMYMVYPWFMPLLFIVSGISARLYLENHSDKEFIKTRSRKLLVPSTIGLFVFYFIQGYLSMSIGNAFEEMKEVPAVIKYFIMVLSGSGVLWYIQLLWLFSIILILIRKIEKDRLWKFFGKTNVLILIILALPVWASAQILNAPVIIVFRFGLYAFIFFTGYFIFSHDEVIEKLKKYFFFFLAAAILLCIIFCSVYFGKNFADAPVNRSILYCTFLWIACLAITGGMSRFADFENSFTKWMKAGSWGLYIFHLIGISAVAAFIAKKELLPPAAVYPLSIAAAFAVAYGLNFLIPRIPFFRWAVMGLKNVQG